MVVAIVLQTTLNSFCEWCRCNILFLYVEKCVVLYFTRMGALIAIDYNQNGQRHERKNEVRDPGVTLDTKLNATPRRHTETY